MPKSFLDTNVLVYASDHDEPDKRRIARELLRRSAQESSGVISTQVVQEFRVCHQEALYRADAGKGDPWRHSGHSSW